MRDLACAICGSSQSEVIYESTLNGWKHSPANFMGAHYRINRCLGCSLVYSSPILDPDEVAAWYTAAPVTNVPHGEEPNIRRTMAGYYQTARQFLLHKQSMLDIGCDAGVLLDIARLDGFESLIGVEPNPLAAKDAELVPGAVILPGFYEDHTFPQRSLDLITLIHVLDHLVDPVPLLRRALTQLKPGGVIFAVVHNQNSLLAHVLGQRFPPYNLQHHFFFSDTTLKKILEAGGFQPLKIVRTRNYYSLGFLAMRQPILPPPLKGMLQSALRRTGMSSVSVGFPLGNIGILARRPEHLD